MGYYARRKIGRCFNGAQRDSGSIFHITKTDSYPSWDKALCGVEPGAKGNGWSDAEELELSTCEKCIVKLEKFLSDPENWPLEQEGLDEKTLECVREEVASNFTREDIIKFSNFKEFLDEVDAQNRYKEEQDKKAYRAYYRKVYTDIKKSSRSNV